MDQWRNIIAWFWEEVYIDLWDVGDCDCDWEKLYLKVKQKKTIPEGEAESRLLTIDRRSKPVY